MLDEDRFGGERRAQLCADPRHAHRLRVPSFFARLVQVPTIGSDLLANLGRTLP